MPYLVQVYLNDSKTNVFATPVETEHAAIKKARGLRAQGLSVSILDPNGNPVDDVGYENTPTAGETKNEQRT